MRAPSPDPLPAGVQPAGFDSHTAVTRAGDGPMRARVAAEWRGYVGAHGGYLAAIALRAATLAVDDAARPVRSLNVQLLEPVAADEVVLHPRVERAGRSTSTATVRLEQDGRTVALATAGFGAQRAGLEHFALELPLVPAPEECEPLFTEPVPEAGFARYVDYHPAAEPLPFAGSSRAVIQVWMRLAERRPVDVLGATFLADAAVPAMYAALTEFVAMPTTDLTLHYGDPTAPADSEWALGVFRTRWAGGGYAVEDGELWSRGGRLLLAARQLRLAR